MTEPAPTGSRPVMSDINPELTKKAQRLTDWSQHEYRVDHGTWITRCVCGWTSEESYDVEGFDRHITETVLATVADDLRAEGAAQALREAAAEMERDEEWGFTGHAVPAWLRSRADRIEARDE